MQYLGLIGFVIVLATLGRWFWRAWQVRVPPSALAFQGLAVLALVLGVASLWLGHGDPFAGWAVGLALLFLYLTTTGAQKAGEGVGVGDAIPEFTAPDDTGEPFDSASLAGSRVLLKFFRGHW